MRFHCAQPFIGTRTSELTRVALRLIQAAQNPTWRCCGGHSNRAVRHLHTIDIAARAPKQARSIPEHVGGILRLGVVAHQLSHHRLRGLILPRQVERQLGIHCSETASEWENADEQQNTLVWRGVHHGCVERHEAELVGNPDGGRVCVE